MKIQMCYLVPEVLTAKRFYERNGYLQSGGPTSVYGLRSVYPTSNSLPLTSERTLPARDR